MRGLARNEVRRIREIEARLCTLHIGERSAVEEAISAVRELIGADNAIFYSLARPTRAGRSTAGTTTATLRTCATGSKPPCPRRLA